MSIVNTEAAARTWYYRGIDLQDAASLKVDSTNSPTVKKRIRKLAGSSVARFCVSFKCFIKPHRRVRRSVEEKGYYRKKHKRVVLPERDTEEDAIEHMFRDIYKYVHDITPPEPTEAAKKQKQNLKKRKLQADERSSRKEKRDPKLVDNKRARQTEERVAAQLQRNAVLDTLRPRSQTTSRTSGVHMAAVTAVSQSSRQQRRHLTHRRKIKQLVAQGKKLNTTFTETARKVQATMANLATRLSTAYDESDLQQPGEEVDSDGANGDVAGVTTEQVHRSPSSQELDDFTTDAALAALSEAQIDKLESKLRHLFHFATCGAAMWTNWLHLVHGIEIGGKFPKMPSTESIARKLVETWKTTEFNWTHRPSHYDLQSGEESILQRLGKEKGRWWTISDRNSRKAKGKR